MGWGMGNVLVAGRAPGRGTDQYRLDGQTETGTNDRFGILWQILGGEMARWQSVHHQHGQGRSHLLQFKQTLGTRDPASVPCFARPCPIARHRPNRSQNSYIIAGIGNSLATPSLAETSCLRRMTARSSGRCDNGSILNNMSNFPGSFFCYKHQHDSFLITI